MRLTVPTMLVSVLLVTISADALAQKKSPAVTRDADHDGVPDMRDRCPATPPYVPVDATGCTVGDAFAPPAPAAAVVAVPAVAVAERTRVGIGVGVGSGTAMVLVPILMPGGMAVEPEIGLSHSTAHFGGFASGDFSVTNLRIGVALHLPMLKGPSLRTYAGPHLGYMKTWTSDTSGGGGSVSVSTGDWYGGFALGGEFFMSPDASIGAEARLDYQRTRSSGSTVTTEGSDLRTSGRVAGRLYFGS